MTFAPQDSRTYKFNELLKQFVSENDQTFYVDVSSAICTGGKCETARDGKILYSDSAHLSAAGSLVTAATILDFVETLKAPYSAKEDKVSTFFEY